MTAPAPARPCEFTLPYALWLLRDEHMHEIWAWLAVFQPPVLTLMRGRPWEDCQ